MASESGNRGAGGVMVQDTGNPVLDSTVNIVTALCLAKYNAPLDPLESLHERILKLAEKEPGGLRDRRGTARS